MEPCSENKLGDFIPAGHDVDRLYTFVGWPIFTEGELMSTHYGTITNDAGNMGVA